ncbi:MAG: tetratricopeptide repeat protein [Sedimentisphaerales bacterium]|nr:tetratricopeptide repeat protein [Sedimentisphaerales bacterium]
MSENSNKNCFVLICLALVIITVAVFYQVRSFDFIGYDDPIYVYNNPNVQSGIKISTIKWAFGSINPSYWHPLTWLSHALDWQIFGFNPGGHHYTNLVFHVANTLLLLVVLNQMTRALWPSAFVAALFALHPLHVESVVWVSERKDVLSTFFWLLTMAAYLMYVRRPGAVRYILVVSCFALGLMSKPMVITLPLVLLLLDYWPLGRIPDFNRRRLYRLILEKIPLFILAAAISVVTFIAQRSAGAVRELAEFPLKIRIFNAFISYIGYIWKMIWPERLAIFYPYSSQGISILYVIVAFAVLLAVTIFVLRFASSRRYLVTGWLWYLITLLPVIGLVQVGRQAFADRYSYVTMIGLFIMIAWGVPELFGKWRYRNIVLFVSALLIISAVLVRTYFQLGHWRNSETVFTHALDVTEDNYMAHFCLAGPLSEQGRFDEVIYHCSEALRINPDFDKAIFGLALAHNSLGGKLYEQGKYDKAIEHFKKALEVKPDYTKARDNLNIVLMEKR